MIFLTKQHRHTKSTLKTFTIIVDNPSTAESHITNLTHFFKKAYLMSFALKYKTKNKSMESNEWLEMKIMPTQGLYLSELSRMTE